jgi:hypothetical protein
MTTFDEELNESMHMMNEICFTELLFEISIRFHKGTEFASKNISLPIPSKVEELGEENKNRLIDHALELITNNVRDFDTVQVWLEEENILVFLLIGRKQSIPECVDIQYVGDIPCEAGVIIDAQPFSDYGGDFSSESVYRYFRRF